MEATRAQLLALLQPLSTHRAELLALLQPFAFGTSYLRIEKLAARFPTHGPQLSALQLLSNAAVSLGWCAAASASAGAWPDLSVLAERPEVLAGLLWTGLVSTALTVVLQTRALSKLSATDSSVIVATEPLWAAGFAALLLGERVGIDKAVGGGLILAGCLANSLLPADFGVGTPSKGSSDSEVE
jgi:drug/metabolite transporter (DMT)-like permease